jgi:cytochrome c oxidase subunit 2
LTLENYSGIGIQHGFSLLPLNMNFQILPGYDHVLTITPTMSGEFQIICNEFCGIGHHLMTGKIIVE